MRVYTRTHSTGANRAYNDIILHGNLPAIIEHLRQNGFYKARLIGHGDNVVIVETLFEKLLRFRGKETEAPNMQEPPDIDQIIAPSYPLYKTTINGCRVLAIDKYKTLREAIDRKEISKEHADILLQHLRVAVTKQHPPCYFWDWNKGDAYNTIKYEQVGLLPDNTPIILDMGSVVERDKHLAYLRSLNQRGAKYLAQATQELEELAEMHLPPIPTQLGWDGKWVTENKKRKTEIFAEDMAKKREQGNARPITPFSKM